MTGFRQSRKRNQVDSLKKIRRKGLRRLLAERRAKVALPEDFPPQFCLPPWARKSRG